MAELKIKLAMLAFLYRGEFVQNLTGFHTWVN